MPWKSTLETKKQHKWPHVRKSCLEWQGLLDKDGYGRVKVNNTDSRVHRAFYEIWHGVKLKTEEVLLHECDNPKCFSPHHLKIGSQAENIRDMDEKGRRVSANTFVTHCPYGHEYTESNTIVYKDGKRRCRTCMKQRKKDAKV